MCLFHVLLNQETISEISGIKIFQKLKIFDYQDLD